MRVGQKNKLIYRWARKGSRPRAIHDQRAGTAPKTSTLPKTSRSCRCRRALNRIFKYFDEIVDHYCYAWNTLIDQPWKIISIARRDWAVAGHLL